MPIQKLPQQTLKELISNPNHVDNRLLMRFYLEFLLTSEIIDSSQDIPAQTIKGFYLDNSTKIELTKECFLKFEDNQKVKILNTQEEFYYRNESKNPKLYYSTKTNNWWFDCSDEFEEVDIDELYYQTNKPKKAINIRTNNYKLENNPKIFTNRAKNTFPIGVKYSYREWSFDDTLFYFDNNIRLLQDKNELFKYRKNSNIAYKDNQKVTPTILEEMGFKSIELKEGYLFYNNKIIKAKKIFYIDEPISTTNKPKNGYIVDKKVYRFEDTLLFKDTKEQDRAIVLKDKIEKKKKIEYIFEKSIAYIFNVEDYQTSQYNIKLRSYHTQPIIQNYIVLYKSISTQITEYNLQDICYKESFKIAEVEIFIYPKNSKIEIFELKDNCIYMEDVESIKSVYLKLLYRLRNSIAHAEFEIRENEILFSNIDRGKIMLRAKIDRAEIDNFIDELRIEI